jgi:hypothetical protein
MRVSRCEAAIRTKNDVLVGACDTKNVVPTLDSDVRSQNFFIFVGPLLLVVLDFLKPEELLPVHFVELRVDVLDCVLEARDEDVFEGVHAPVRHSDDFVEDNESGLNGRNERKREKKGSELDICERRVPLGQKACTCNEASSTSVSTALA